MQEKQPVPEYPPLYNPVPPTYVAPIPVMQQQVAFGPSPVRTECPTCRSAILTEIKYEPSTKTHLLALLCCAVACLGCVPYCVNSCQDANHYCPQCHGYIGKYKM